MRRITQWIDAIFARIHAWTAKAATRHAIAQGAGLPMWAGPNDTICDFEDVWALDTYICDTEITPHGGEQTQDGEQAPSPWARTVCTRPPVRRKALPRR